MLDSCHGYSWGNPSTLPSNPCYLLTNVTAYTTVHIMTIAARVLNTHQKLKYHAHR